MRKIFDIQEFESLHDEVLYLILCFVIGAESCCMMMNKFTFMCNLFDNCKMLCHFQKSYAYAFLYRCLDNLFCCSWFSLLHHYHLFCRALLSRKMAGNGYAFFSSITSNLMKVTSVYLVLVVLGCSGRNYAFSF